MVSKFPIQRGNFEGKGAAHCKVPGLSAMSCAKMAESIEMPFGMWTRVGPRKHILDRVHISANSAATMRLFVKLL